MKYALVVFIVGGFQQPDAFWYWRPCVDSFHFGSRPSHMTCLDLWKLARMTQAKFYPFGRDACSWRPGPPYEEIHPSYWWAQLEGSMPYSTQLIQPSQHRHRACEWKAILDDPDWADNPWNRVTAQMSSAQITKLWEIIICHCFKLLGLV